MAKKRPLTAEDAIRWSEWLHGLFIQNLIDMNHFTLKDLAFHGGTSLRLSWGSRRHSEDLDFLMTASALDTLASSLPKILDRMNRQLNLWLPGLKVESKQSNRNNVLTHVLSLHHPDILGKVLTKAEFYEVTPEYLKGYPTHLVIPKKNLENKDILGVITSHVPAADLGTAYADKLTAIATRPHLKWRDLYDLWWLKAMMPTEWTEARLCQQFLHNASAYTIRDQQNPGEALLNFVAQQDPEQLIKQAETDLKRWLTEEQWAQIYPDVLRMTLVPEVLADIERFGRLITGRDTLENSPCP